eukprot:2709962-Rhodomonas_salina.5
MITAKDSGLPVKPAMKTQTWLGWTAGISAATVSKLRGRCESGEQEVPASDGDSLPAPTRSQRPQVGTQSRVGWSCSCLRLSG